MRWGEVRREAEKGESRETNFKTKREKCKAPFTCSDNLSVSPSTGSHVKYTRYGPCVIKAVLPRDQSYITCNMTVWWVINKVLLQSRVTFWAINNRIHCSCKGAMLFKGGYTLPSLLWPLMTANSLDWWKSFSVVQNHLARVNDQNEYFWWDYKVIKLTS